MELEACQDGLEGRCPSHPQYSSTDAMKIQAQVRAMRLWSLDRIYQILESIESVQSAESRN